VKTYKTTVLDQPEEIRKIDKSELLKHCLKTSIYCKEALQSVKKVSVRYGRPQHIVVVGMGGSAIGGEILRDWLMDELPVSMEVCRDYNLPAYVNEDTLVFAISCSGKTEETLTAFVDAVKRGCKIITVTSGGHLLAFSEKLGLPHVIVPSDLPSRVTLPYLFFPLPLFLEKLGVLQNKDKEIQETIEIIEKLSRENSIETPATENSAKKLALELRDTIPVIYGFRQYAAIARRLKTQLNENSKIPSRNDTFPELNHNEVVAWEASEALTKRFSVVLIRDHKEPPEIRHRIEATKSLVLQKAEKVLEIHTRGDSKLARIFSVLFMGDLTSVYLAILHNTDPTPVETINKLKEEMKKRFTTIDRLKKEVESR